MSDKFLCENAYPYRYIDRFNTEYPARLSDIKDPPAGIYVKGALPDPAAPSVAIVGSRICSQYGRLAAEDFGYKLAEHGVQIISGLARGIDGISQNAACRAGGRSFGVLGCGINVIYPAQNSRIYTDLLTAGGGLISEVSPDAPPIGKQFASRNRIISALADIVLVIEAKERSGTQITVSRALEQGRDVYALPGRIYDICSQGCNKLITQGAGIASSVDTILDALSLKYSISDRSDTSPEVPVGLDDLERRVYELLDYYPTDLDSLSSSARLMPGELYTILFHLQMKGYVSCPSQGFYIRTGK